MQFKALATAGLAAVIAITLVGGFGSARLSAQLLYGTLVGNVSDGTGASFRALK